MRIVLAFVLSFFALPAFAQVSGGRVNITLGSGSALTSGSITTTADPGVVVASSAHLSLNGSTDTANLIYDGTDVILNAPSGKGFRLKVNGTSELTLSSAGLMTVIGGILANSGTPYTANQGDAGLWLNNGTTDTPGVHFQNGNSTNWGIDASAAVLRFVKNLDEASGAVYASFDYSSGNAAFGTTGIPATVIVKNTSNAATIALTGSSGDITATSVEVSATTNKGQITMTGGSGTATVVSGARCVCSDDSATPAVVRCQVSATTLTATGTSGHVADYICL